MIASEAQLHAARLRLVEEYKEINANLRSYSALRFQQLTVFIGVTTLLVTALFQQMRLFPVVAVVGLITTVSFYVMEIRSTAHWYALEDRAKDIEADLAPGRLALRPMSQWTRHDPSKFRVFRARVNATLATVVFFLMVASLWSFVLYAAILRISPDPDTTAVELAGVLLGMTGILIARSVWSSKRMRSRISSGRSGARSASNEVSLLETTWLRVRSEDLVQPDGRSVREFYSVDMPDYAVVVAWTASGGIVLGRQYRHAVGREVWELPTGRIEESEDPSSCGRRELKEEAAYNAETFTESAVLTVDGNRGCGRAHIVIATHATSNGVATDGEMADVTVKSPEEAINLIQTGEVATLHSAAALLYAIELRREAASKAD